MASRGSVDVYLLPDQTVECWPQKVKVAKYKGQHQPRKYGIKKGDGRDLGWVICVACADSQQRPAITREEVAIEERAELAELAAIEDERARLHRSAWQRYRP